MKTFKSLAVLISISAILSSCSKTEIATTNSTQISTFSTVSSTRLSPYKSVITGNNKIKLLVDGDEIFPEIFNVIDSAEKSIYVSTYLFGESIGHKIAEKLIAKKKAGVQIEFVAEATMGSIPELVSAAKKEYKFMIDNGVQVKTFPVDLLPKGPTFLSNKKVINHSKMVVADGKSVIIGGMNLKDTESVNHDYMLRIDGEAAAELGKIGNDDWSKSRALSIKALTDNASEPLMNVQSPPLASNEVEIAQTGFKEQSIGNMLLNQINNAQSSIKIEVLLMDHHQIVDALVNAKKRGVDVKVIVDQADLAKYSKFLEDLPIQGMANFSAVMSLLDAGIEVKWFIPQKKDQVLHAKTILIDNKTFITGSANFTYHALTRNHEISVSINNPEVASRYSQVFEQDWASKTKKAELTKTQRLIGKVFKKFGDYVYKMSESDLINESRKQAE